MRESLITGFFLFPGSFLYTPTEGEMELAVIKGSKLSQLDGANDTETLAIFFFQGIIYLSGRLTYLM